MTLRAPCAVIAAAALACAACGGGSTGPSGPSVTIGPTVTGISPASGSTLGGTAVTISGANFAAGATVTIGGAAATSVVVASSTAITAVTGARSAGAADVTVTVNGQSSTLAAAFTYAVLPAPTVTAISPASGTTLGGTSVRITGTNFAAGAAVAIGGVSATAVSVASTTSLTAVTGAHAAGAVDVIVTVAGQSGALAGAFTYTAPGQNQLPVITAITVQSTRPNAPPDYADLGESVPVTATVTDAETPIGGLTFAWSADAGTFTGTGPSVTWKAPASASTPLTVTLTLKVTETVAAANGAGITAAVTQTVTKTAMLGVHDSLGEIGTLARQFLLDFSDSKLTPSYVVRNFYDGCPGKADELDDVTRNRTYYLIRSFTIGQPTSVSVGFSAGCAVPGRGTRPGDGCAVVPCEWHDTYLPTGATGTTIGPDYLTAVFRSGRWWLCNSDFPLGTTTSPVSAPSFIK